MNRAFFSGLLLLAALSSPAFAARDPFWPIGYEPPKPESEVEEVAVAPAPVVKAPEPLPAKPQPPPVKPVSEADWNEARKALTISGFVQSVRPDTGETRTQVMINRKTFSAGDTLSVTNRNIHFVWRLDTVAERDLKLAPVKATRISAKPSEALK